MDSELATVQYGAEVTPLSRGPRADWAVPRPDLPIPADAPDFVDTMRRFFAEMDGEIERRKDDVVATATGLAKIDALLADIRYVRDRLRDETARNLNEQFVRRLVIEGVINVEGTSTTETEWDNKKAMMRTIHGALDAQAEFDDPRWIEAETGVMLDVEALADAILANAAISYWRKTALTAAGIDPSDVSETETGDDGKPVRTPTVRIHDNLIRKAR